MDPVSVVKIIGNLRYSTDKATLIASDAYAEEIIKVENVQEFVPGSVSIGGDSNSYSPPHIQSTTVNVVTRVYERGGRNVFLYKTEKGHYFLVNQTTLKGEVNTLIPLVMEDAGKLYYESLPVHLVEPEIAFPDYLIEDA